MILIWLALLTHGEDKPGPHNGYVRMPGAFHTEILLTRSGMRVYLLDIQWKPSSIADSKVQAHYEAKKISKDMPCEAHEDFFDCRIPTGFDAQLGKIKLKVKKGSFPEAQAEYELPLKLSQPK